MVVDFMIQACFEKNFASFRGAQNGAQTAQFTFFKLNSKKWSLFFLRILSVNCDMSDLTD